MLVILPVMEAVWETDARNIWLRNPLGCPPAKRHGRGRVYLFVYRDTRQPEQNVWKTPKLAVDLYRRITLC